MKRLSTDLLDLGGHSHFIKEVPLTLMKKGFVAVAVCLGLLLSGCASETVPSNEELWAAAMTDAVFSEDD